MHYYRHHIGDMIKDTAHLSNEHLAVYMRMIWKYYQDEKGFADECENLAFALRSDEKTVRLLLNYYFKMVDGIWTHARCEREIVGLYAKSDAARSSAKARWRDKDAMQKPCERIEAALLNDADARKIDATQLPSNPVTQLPNKKKEKSAVAPVVQKPEEVSQQVWGDWLQLRKTKRATVSATVIAEAKCEADKAGLTLERFFAVWCARGSQGLVAEWLKPNERGGGGQHFNKQEALEASNAAVAERFLRNNGYAPN